MTWPERGRTRLPTRPTSRGPSRRSMIPAVNMAVKTTVNSIATEANTA